MDRLRASVALALAALAVASAPLHAGGAPTQPEPYFRHADMASVALSPSGKRIAALAPVQGRVALMMFDVTWSDMAYSDYIRYSARTLVGDPDTEGDRLREVSPLEPAAKIKAPVLMAYGGGDRRVPIVHGERMRDALRQQGTPVEWVVYSDEGHGLRREANRYDFYARVKAYLATHLK